MERMNSPEDIFTNSYLRPGILKKTASMPEIPTGLPVTGGPRGQLRMDEIVNAIPDDLEPAEIVSRKDWGAREPKGPGKKVATPVKIVVLKYGTKTPPCESKEECIKIVQEIQRRHMDELGMKDIGYNSDGTIYEGRGWTTRTRPYPVKDNRYKKLNKHSIDVVFIGNWTDEPPLADMMSAVADLCVEGEKKGYLHPDWMVFEPSRLKKQILRHPIAIKSKRDDKYNLNSFDEWFKQLHQ